MKSFIQVCLVIISHHCFSQTSELSEIRETIESFLRTNPLSGVSLLTNQEEYVPGDSIYFSAYFLNSDGSVPTGKIILSLRLRNPMGSISDQGYLVATEGVAFGQITVSDTISAGIYQLEFVQKHHDREMTLLNKDLTIVEQFEVAEGDYISFYPEGGDFIESVQNRILVHTTPGKKAVQIIDDKGLTESIITLDTLGYGILNITPAKPYFAITDKGRVSIPQPKPDGISVQLIEQNKSANKFILRIPPNSKYHQENIYAYAIMSGKISYASMVQFEKNDSVLLEIPDRFASPMVSELLLVSATRKILASRTFISIVNEVPHISIKVNKENIYQRDSVMVDVQVKVLDQVMASRASVSVVNQNVFSAHGSHEYLTNTGLIRNSVKYPWESIINDPIEFNTWKNESKIKLKGRAIFSQTREPVPDSTIIYFYLQKNFMGYEATAIKNGYFDLTFLYDFYGNDRLFFFAENLGKPLRDIKIIWDNNLNSGQSKTRKFEISEKASLYNQFKKSQLLIKNSFSFFNQLDNQQLVKENPNKEFEDEFMGADVVINVGDYVVFPSMIDLVREVIPNLQHRNIKGADLIRVIFSNNLIKPTDDPLYIIDGFMTKDTRLFLSLKPADLISVKVIKDIYKLNTIGFLGRNGIVYVQSKKDKAISLGNDEHFHQVQGIIKPNIPPLGLKKKGNERIPDFRSTLYWNPTMKSGADGYLRIPIKLSDDVGKILFKISGVSDSGQAFFSQKVFQIEFRAEY